VFPDSPGTLSTGNLQRLGLARALLHEPELLILDEPANGLDPAGVVEIRELLSSLARDKGVTIFMSSHILTEVDRLATRIGIIHLGKLIEELDTHALEELRSKRLEVKARNLEAAQHFLQGAGYKAMLSHEAILMEEPQARYQLEYRVPCKAQDRKHVFLNQNTKFEKHCLAQSHEPHRQKI